MSTEEMPEPVANHRVSLSQTDSRGREARCQWVEKTRRKWLCHSLLHASESAGKTGREGLCGIHGRWIREAGGSEAGNLGIG